MNYTHTKMGGQSPSVFRRFSGWLVALLGLTALVATASAQTASITGRVINQGTGEYLKYAQVQIVGTDKSAITEAEGVFTLTNVPAGEVKITVTYTGLDTLETTLTVPPQGTVTHDFNLTTSDYGDTIKLGAFSVSGAREGNAKAIVEQRVALNVKTVIAADAFGDVSEGNVGEFLKLLPGVSVDYVDNDARSTRLRGLPPKYNTTTLDGHPIANAASSSITTGRQLELEQVSIASMDILETTKTPTSDLMSPNLAGNINAISKSAFGQKGRSIKYQANYNFNQWNMSFDKSKGWDNESHSKALPNGKLEYIDTFLDGKLGVVASVAHSGSYAEQRITIGSQTWDKNPDNNATEMPLVTQWNFQHGLKPTWRDSLLLNLDYKANDDLKLSLRTSYGYYRSEFYNRNWLVNENTAGLSTTTTAAGSYDPLTGNLATVPAGIVNRTETSADSLGSSTTSYARVLGSNQRKSGGTFVTSPAVSWKHDNLKVDASTSYSQAKNAYASGQDGYFSLVQADMRNVAFHYDRVADDKIRIQQTTSTVAAGNGSIFALGNYNAGGSVNNERRNSKDQMWTANADAELAFPDWNVPTTFKVGGASSLEVRDISNFQAKWNMALTNSAPSSATAINLQDYQESFGGGVGEVYDINGTWGKTPAPDKWKLFQLFQSYGNTDPLATTANGPFTAQGPANLRYLLQNQFDVKENIDSAYAMATVKPTSKLSLVAGLRFEKTKTQGRGFDDQGVDRTLAALGLTYGTTVGTTGVATSRAGVNSVASNRYDYIYYRYGARVDREKSYDNVLPVVQARYEINKNFIARGAFYSSILRPDFSSVIGGVSAGESADASFYTFSINNTTLKPETANNLDASIEYYFEPVGVVSATVFYKDVKDIQISQPANALSTAPADVREQVASAGYSDADLANPLSQYTTTINGPKTSLWGFEVAYNQELSFLPGAFKGLGVTANFSHYVPKDERLWALVPNAGDGMSKNLGNLILRYKYRKFKTQVSATWTDKRISSLSGLSFQNGVLTPGSITGNNNNNVTFYQGERWVFSTSAEYQIHRYATVYVGVNNFLNSAKFNYAERPNYTTRNGNYGASINVGVKGSF